MSMTPNEEILSIIRYAPGPIGAAGIYEQCKSIENINDVSSRLSQLYAQGKVVRHEITTGNNRTGFAYTLPKPVAEAAPPIRVEPAAAPAAAAPAPLTGVRPAEPAPAAEAAGKAGKAKRKPKAQPAPAAPKTDAQAAAAPAVPAGAGEKIAQGIGQMAREVDASRLADAIIRQLKRDLAPTLAEMEAAVGLDRLNVHVHIAQVDIHLGGL